ncbi:hypothetical protein ACFL4T_01595 [candidate division KSB1 bacterium]
MAQDHVVRIIKHKNKPSKITNGNYLAVKKGSKAADCDSIIFKAHKTNAVVFVPDISIFGEHVFPVNDGIAVEKQIQPGANLGVHYYAIWNDEDKDFAEANSNPSIIIED